MSQSLRFIIVYGVAILDLLLTFGVMRDVADIATRLLSQQQVQPDSVQ